jgi:hypothetical protein
MGDVWLEQPGFNRKVGIYYKWILVRCLEWSVWSSIFSKSMCKLFNPRGWSRREVRTENVKKFP